MREKEREKKVWILKKAERCMGLEREKKGKINRRRQPLLTVLGMLAGFATCGPLSFLCVLLFHSS